MNQLDMFPATKVADAAGQTTQQFALFLAQDCCPQLNALAANIHRLNAHWYKDPATGQPVTPNVGEKLCLVHSEISEALEGARKNKQDDHLPHRKSEEVELADALIRILDWAAYRGFDIGSAVSEKLAYNTRRVDHTDAARLAGGGKQF